MGAGTAQHCWKSANTPLPTVQSKASRISSYPSFPLSLQTE